MHELIADASLGDIVDGVSGEVWSRTRMASEIDSVLAQFSLLGLRPGQRIILESENNPLFFAALIGAWRTGLCVVPLDAQQTKREIDSIINQCKPAARVSFKKQIQIVKTLSAEAEILDECLILFTSGSSGKPKGVVHSWKSLKSRLSSLRSAIPLRDIERSICLLPVFFGHGLIGNSLLPYLSGQTLILFPAGSMRTIGNLGAVVDSHEATFVSSVPSFWSLGLRSEPPQLQTLRRVHCASSPLRNRTLDSLKKWASGAVVRNVYGMTELGSWISGAAPDDLNCQEGYLGRGWGVNFRIVDSLGEILGPGESGEIEIKGSSLMKGYLENPESTSETISEGWLKSGDRGRLDQAGGLVLEGRLKNIVIRGGRKISPEEVTSVLSENEHIEEAHVFGVADGDEELLVAAIVLNAASPAKCISDVETWLSERVSSYKIPGRWILLSSLPKTNRGKVDLLSLKKLASGTQ